MFFSHYRAQRSVVRVQSSSKNPAEQHGDETGVESGSRSSQTIVPGQLVFYT